MRLVILLTVALLAGGCTRWPENARELTEAARRFCPTAERAWYPPQLQPLPSEDSLACALGQRLEIELRRSNWCVEFEDPVTHAMRWRQCRDPNEPVV